MLTVLTVPTVLTVLTVLTVPMLLTVPILFCLSSQVVGASLKMLPHDAS
jgi:hypothetical protein